MPTKRRPQNRGAPRKQVLRIADHQQRLRRKERGASQQDVSHWRQCTLTMLDRVDEVLRDTNMTSRTMHSVLNDALDLDQRTKVSHLTEHDGKVVEAQSHLMLSRIVGSIAPGARQKPIEKVRGELQKLRVYLKRVNAEFAKHPEWHVKSA
jgi:hypothetical protein